MENKSYYIARDKDKSLWMYIYKPCRGRDNKFWLTCSSADGHILAAKLATKGNTYPYVDLFNNLSFEDEPLKLLPKKTNEHVDGKSYFIAADDNGRVYLFNRRPVKNEENGTWKVAPEGHCQPFEPSSTFKSGIFKNLTYDNDPVELVLVDEDESSTEEPTEELMKKYVETKSYYIVRNPNDADNLEPFFHGLHYWNEPLKLVHVNKTINRPVNIPNKPVSKPVEEKPIESCFDRLFDISLT